MVRPKLFPVAILEFGHDLSQCDAARAQQHEHVEQQVGRLADDLVHTLGGAGECELNAFDTQTGVPCSPRTLRDDILEPGQKGNARCGCARLIAEAGERAVVTGRPARPRGD